MSWYINDGIWIRKYFNTEIKDVDYRPIIWNIGKSEAVNKMNYSTLENQGSL